MHSHMNLYADNDNGMKIKIIRQLNTNDLKETFWTIIRIGIDTIQYKK